MGVAIPNLLTEDRVSGAQIVDGSLRFDINKSQYLTRTPGSSGNTLTWTWSGWIKRNILSYTAYPFRTPSVDEGFYFSNNDNIEVYRYSGSFTYFGTTPGKYRDPSAWYHVVYVHDATATTGSRLKIYVNGVLQGPLTSLTDISLNTGYSLNTAVAHRIGEVDGEMSQVYFIDGQALGPGYFGYTDPLTNTWRPKKFSGYFNQQIEDFTDTLPILNTNSDGSSVTSGTRTDDLNSNWILGLAMNTSANIYTDLSPSAGDATDYSNIVTSTNTSRFYGTSAYFNGTNSQLVVNDTRFNFSATNFTMETWIYVPTTPTESETVFVSSNPDLIGSSSTAGVLVGWSAGNQLFVYVGSDSTPSITASSTTAVSIKKWHHIAIAKSGSTITLYIDGISRGTTTTSVGNSTSGLYVAYQPTNARWFEAYYQDLRVYTTAKYTTNFTPPVGSINSFYLPLDGNTPIGQDQSGNGRNWTPVNFGGSNTLEKATGALPILNTDGGGKVARVGVRTDSSASSLVLALPLVGIKSDFSNAINSGTSNKAITANGNAAASSAQSNFYGGSFAFDGTGDYLQTTVETLSGDFCVEGWWYPSSSGQQTFFTLGDAATSTGIQLYRSSGTSNLIIFGSAGSIISSGVDYTLNKWQHFALTRSGTSLRLFKDGIQIGSTVTNSTAFNSTLRIGVEFYSSTLAQYLTGYVQDFRVYNGLAKYTQNFIPASTDPDILPDTPSGVSYSSNVTAITDGAVAFDGSGDYLSISDGSDLELGNGDFTIEGYYYFKNTGSSGTNFWGKWASTPGRSYAFSYVKSSGKYIFGYSTNGTDETLSAEFVSPADIDRWVHFAAVRSGTSLKVYRDGKEIIDYNISTTTIYNSSANLLIGRLESNSNYDFNGFVSNFRLVKGTALYTSNFTPPSAPLTSVQNTKLLCCQSNVTSGAAAVSPNISGINDGTVWSSNASGNLLPYSNYAYSIANAFDGSTSTFAMTASSNGDVVATTVTLPGLTSGHTVEFYASKNTNAGTLTFNGSTVSLTSSAGWVTAGTANGTSDNFVMTPNPGQSISDDLKVFAVRVNGTILIDPVSPKGNVIIGGATNFNPFTVNINTQRGQESGYATWNPLKMGTSDVSMSEGNLFWRTTSNGPDRITVSTIGMTRGKYYWENEVVEATATGIGIANEFANQDSGPASTHCWIYYSATGQAYLDGSASSYGAAYNTNGTIIGVAFDRDNLTLEFYRNGISQGKLTNISGLTDLETYFAMCGDSGGASQSQVRVNFGQKPFKFPPPTGFQPLALANTPRPSIVRPDQYVGVTTYSSNSGTAYQVSGLKFSPDLIITKNRDNGSGDWNLQDTVRGVSAVLTPSEDYAESTQTDNLNSITADGFTVGTGARFNNGTQGICSWVWKAGGPKFGGQSAGQFWKDGVQYASAAAAGLTAGDITPTGASIGTKQGFSIITYTGRGNNESVPHGLGRKPSITIIKNRDDATSWPVFFDIIDGSMDQLYLETASTKSDQASLPAYSTTTFGVLSGSGSGQLNKNYVAYVWADVPGVQKFGSYTGNSNADGPFIELGFRPALIIIKKDSASWTVLDKERDKTNVTSRRLFVDGLDAEASSTNGNVDFLSNGFKIRTSHGGINASATHIYFAWAETPTFNLYGGQANAR